MLSESTVHKKRNDPNLRQVFDHPEHVFQSSRCESELAASSTAEEVNGHPPDTIAIAVHCVSLEGDAPRQVSPLSSGI